MCVEYRFGRVLLSALALLLSVGCGGERRAADDTVTSYAALERLSYNDAFLPLPQIPPHWMASSLSVEPESEGYRVEIHRKKGDGYELVFLCVGRYADVLSKLCQSESPPVPLDDEGRLYVLSPSNVPADAISFGLDRAPLETALLRHSRFTSLTRNRWEPS